MSGRQGCWRRSANSLAIASLGVRVMAKRLMLLSRYVTSISSMPSSGAMAGVVVVGLVAGEPGCPVLLPHPVDSFAHLVQRVYQFGNLAGPEDRVLPVVGTEVDMRARGAGVGMARTPPRDDQTLVADSRVHDSLGVIVLGLWRWSRSITTHAWTVLAPMPVVSMIRFHARVANTRRVATARASMVAAVAS